MWLSGGGQMKSRIVKRSIAIGGHKTSVSLENEFWRDLKEIAIGRQATLSRLVEKIGAGRAHRNLSSSLRIFVLEHYQAEALRHQADAAGAPSGAPPLEAGQFEVGAAQEST